jgi:4-hydroxy-3-methylbut-2-en-1-yl diphosphate synthase IspG/GcpE
LGGHFDIFQVFTPLVEKCKKYGRAMRIGTNHGSLSDRIMSYYGDSPRGMVIISSFLTIYLTIIWQVHDIFCTLISG